MNNTRKEFDSVEMMRSSRDKISTAIEGMTVEEELKWLASQEINNPFLKRLRERIIRLSETGAPRRKVS